MTLATVLADLQTALADATAAAPSVVGAINVAIADVQAMLGPGVPAWRKGLPVGAFVPIPGSSLSAITTDADEINDWSGLAAGLGQWYAVCEDGHTDGSSNAAYAIDLTADAPKWTQLRATSPVATDAPTGYYSDGTPAARHTYNSPIVINARQRVMLFGAVAVYRNSYTLQNVDGFRLTDNAYDSAGTYASVPYLGNIIAMSVAKHPVTEDVYVGTVDQMWAKWTQATATWTKFSPSTWTYGGYQGMVVDAKRNRLVLADHDKLTFIDCTSYVVTTLPLTGVASQPAWPSQWALTHDFDLDQYYVGHTDGRVYKIDPVSGAASVIATLPTAVNGLQNKFAYFPAVKGIACYPVFSGPILFMATQ